MVDRDGLEALRHRGESLFELAIERMQRIRANGRYPLTGQEAERVRAGLGDLRQAVSTQASRAAEEAGV